MELIDSGIYLSEAKPWYVMRRADCSLSAAVERYRGDIVRVISVLIEIAHGVAVLHENGIIHRDLKPDNILLFGDRPRIADLGLALLIDKERITSTGEAVGPRYYMAPELEDGRNLDVTPAADVYSLGKVFYFLLSGGCEFSRENYHPHWFRLKESVGDPRLSLVEPVFRKSITQHPFERFSTGREFLENILSLMQRIESHPRTTILDTFGSLHDAIKAKTDAINRLNDAEQVELIDFALRAEHSPPMTFVRSVLASLSPVTAVPLARLLINKANDLSHALLVHAAARIVITLSSVEKLSMRLRPDETYHLLLWALESGQEDCLDVVASWSFFELRNHPDLLTHLARDYDRLSLNAKTDFLVASYRTHYSQKEELLLRLSTNVTMDDIAFEALIAGLAACGSESAIRRLVEIADAVQEENRLGAVLRGVLLGAGREGLPKIAMQPWSNKLLQQGFDLAVRSLQTGDAEPNRGGEDDLE